MTVTAVEPVIVLAGPEVVEVVVRGPQGPAGASTVEAQVAAAAALSSQQSAAADAAEALSSAQTALALQGAAGVAADAADASAVTALSAENAAALSAADAAELREIAESAAVNAANAAAAAQAAAAQAGASAEISVDGSLAAFYEQITPEVDTAFRFVALDPDGNDISLARIREDGVVEVQGLAANTLTVDGNVITGEDFGAETYDAIGYSVGVYYVDADYQILKYSPYESEVGGGNFAAEAAASAAEALESAEDAQASAAAAVGLASAASAAASAAAVLAGGSGLAQPYALINDDADTAFRFVAPDANGVDRSLVRITGAGEIEAQTLAANSLTIGGNVVTGEDFGAETYDAMGYSVGVYYVDADYQILKYSPYETEAGGGSVIPPDDIRAFAPTIDLTGATDMSVDLRAAHDAARADGYRHLFIEGPILAPDAQYLGDVMFLSRSGKGRLIETYLKKVIPVGTSSAPYWSRIVPERHLTRLRTKLQTATPEDPAIITWVSDSVGRKSDAISYQSTLEGIIGREVARQFGPDAEKIRVISRGIGGTQWQNADRATATVTPGMAGVQWITTEAPWLDYVQSIEQPDLTPTARTPDVVCFFFGMNHTAYFTPQVMGQIHSIIAEVESYSPKPDIIMIAHMVPSVMSTVGIPVRGGRVGQEKRRSAAGWARYYAAFRGFGLIDFGRAQDCECFGFDPWQTSWRNLIPLGPLSLNIPWTCPEIVHDYGLTFYTDAPSVFWADAEALVFTLSPVAGNVLILEKDSGTNRLAYTVMAATGIPSIARTVTRSKAVTAPTIDIEVSIRGEMLTIAYADIVVVNRPIERAGGEFTPVITTLSGNIVQATYQGVFVGVPLTVMPSIIDSEAWGEPGGASGIGGTGDNHPSEIGRVAIMDKTLSSTRFA